MVCRTTVDGCWGCGSPWERLHFEPLAYDTTDTGYYCERCDVYSKKIPPDVLAAMTPSTPNSEAVILLHVPRGNYAAMARLHPDFPTWEAACVYLAQVDRPQDYRVSYMQ